MIKNIEQNIGLDTKGIDDFENFEITKNNKKDKTDEIDKLVKMQEYFIQEKRDIFDRFAKTSGIKIKPGNGFHIEFKKPIEISLDAKDWKMMQERKFTEEEVIWSTLHELAHFLDMISDPEGMMNNFKYMKKKAKNLTPKAKRIWINALKTEEKNLPDYVTDKYIEKFLYSKLSNLYNCLDDMYVNRLVASKLPGRYLPKRGIRSKTVENLYKNYLFEEKNLTKLSKSSQFAYSLLRDTMIENEKTKISPEVEAVMNKKIKVGGKFITLRELAKIISFPISITAKYKNIPSYRNLITKNYIEPEFWKLFWEDLKNFPPPKKQEKGGNKGEKGEGGGKKKKTNQMRVNLKMMRKKKKTNQMRVNLKMMRKKKKTNRMRVNLKMMRKKKKTKKILGKNIIKLIQLMKKLLMIF